MVLSHQKPSIFASFFHWIFMFFPNPLPETIFRGSKCQPILDGAILEPFWIQGGPKNGPIGHRFRPPWRQKWYPGSLRKPSASRPGRDLAPKTVQEHIFIDLGSIFNRFWKDFEWFSTAWSFNYRILKCPLRPLFSDILLLIIRLWHFKMSAQTPLFGHFTFDHSIITF